MQNSQSLHNAVTLLHRAIVGKLGLPFILCHEEHYPALNLVEPVRVRKPSTFYSATMMRNDAEHWRELDGSACGKVSCSLKASSSLGTTLKVPAICATLSALWRSVISCTLSSVLMKSWPVAPAGMVPEKAELAKCVPKRLCSFVVKNVVSSLLCGCYKSCSAETVGNHVALRITLGVGGHLDCT